MPNFTPMVKILKPCEQGGARIEHFKITMMSDTPMERQTNCGILYSTRGDVLIAGLGLGMILVPILAKKEVESVTVIEKSQDVIDLVVPQLKERHRRGHLHLEAAEGWKVGRHLFRHLAEHVIGQSQRHNDAQASFQPPQELGWFHVGMARATMPASPNGLDSESVGTIS